MAEFAPCWLFHATREPQLVETQAMYDSLMADGSWADSPAVWGIITAPNREQMALGSLGSMPTGSVITGSVQGTGPLSGIQNALHDQESELEALHTLVAALRDKVTVLEDTVAALVPDKSERGGKK